MHRQQISRSSSSDELSSRVLIHSGEKTSEHTLPINIIPSSSITTSSSTTTKTTRSATYTQTVKDIPISKSTPSFAETQLLSVYYPSQDSKNPPTNDKCIFVEQQDRQPVRVRTAYDPSAPSKSTQTSPLSTHGSTLIINGNSDSGQYLKIHSGTQNLSNELPDDDSSSLPHELVQQSRYTYEEYFVNLNENQTRTTTSSSSSSSATTVIPQNEELDSESERISSWPPVPNSLNNEEKRPIRVQFAEDLVHVIPISTTNSLNEEPISPPPVLPRTNINDLHQPIKQSKWIQTHIDTSDIQNKTQSNRVNTLRSLFEQQNTLSTTLNKPIRTIESEEKPSKHGVEIRFRVNDPHIHHAEPVKVIPASTSSSTTAPFTLEQIQQITGKQYKNFDNIGRYLSDGHTWQWDEVFWLSLTISQRDQFKDLEQRVLSRQNSFDNSLSSVSSSSTTTEAKRFKSTISMTGTGTRQTNKSPSVLTKYTEVNTINEIQPSVNVFGTTTTTKINSEETKRIDNQISMNESGYNSADDQQKFRPHNNPIIEESIDLNYDPLSYEQFIFDYLSTHSKQLHSNDGTIILSIDEQKLHLSSINENLILSKQIYIDAINHKLPPFETELNQLVIFLSNEIILIPTDRWLFYRKKYSQSKWLSKLKKINRNIPNKIIPFIEEWLSQHAKLDLNKHEVNVDGINIPIIQRLDEINTWNDLLKYLIHIGFVSYNSNEKLISIANSELDIQKILNFPSDELIERLAKHLRLLNIHFNNENGMLIINEYFQIPNKYIEKFFRKHQQGEDLNANELAELLLNICEIEEDEEKDILILIFNNQILRLINENHRKYLIQWLQQLNERKLINITEQNDIIIDFNHNQQQIIIKHEHVDEYMKTKSIAQQTDTINLNDIVHILILYDYIQYSSGQFKYRNHIIELETKEFIWLESIIKSIRIIEHIQQTEIELFDGQHTQMIKIPYEYMSPTNNSHTIANYLYQNGHIRHDTNTGYYTYSYASPHKETHSVERSSQHEFLLSHIQHIHIDKNHQKIEIEFIHDPNHFLQLPSNWYQDISKHNFDRSYIINMLLHNGGIIQEDNFIFNNYSYSLKSSSKEKEKLIDFYVEYINNHDGIKFDNETNLLILVNPLDNSELYLTKEHTQFIHQNKYRRQDMKYLLNKHSKIEQDKFGNWLLYYNDQCIQLPSMDQTDEQVKISHHNSKTNDSNLKLLFPSNKSLRLIQKTPSTTTLDIEQPNETNDYTIDPLLILANYIHRVGTIYEDEFNRLVIKLNRDEIVVPRHQAISSIQEINTSPNRTGTIIARLISRLGKVQSTKTGGLIITIGKDSLELSKEIIDQSKITLNQSNENLSSSKSSDSLASSRSMNTTRKTQSQTSLCIKPRFLIIHDNENNDRTTRFYIQYIYEEDRRTNSVMMLPNNSPVRPTQPRLIAPEHYQDITLRDAMVYVRHEDKNEVFYENLAQYLSTNQTDLSSRTIRRMLKFTSRDEYFAYLHNQMSANLAEEFIRKSEELSNETSKRFTNIRIGTPDREINNQRERSTSPGAFYNVKNGRTSNEVFERSASLSSLSSDMLITNTYPSNRTIPIS